MAIQRQLRRGTKAENDGFTGAIGELVQDTENDRIIIHDGSKSGGFPVPNYLDLQSRYFTTGDAVQDTAGDYVLTLPYAPVSYIENQVFTIIPDSNNLGACDINVNGLGLKDIQKFDSEGVLEELEADDLKAGVPFNIYYNGVRFALIQNGGGGGDKPIASVTPSGVANVAFNDIFRSGFDYEIRITHLTPTSDGAILYADFSDDGGSTYETGWSNMNIGVTHSDLQISNGTNGDAQVDIAGGFGVGSGGNESVSANSYLFDPSNINEVLHGTTAWVYESTVSTSGGGSGGFTSNSLYSFNSMRIRFSSGNIESGSITIYERAKS